MARGGVERNWGYRGIIRASEPDAPQHSPPFSCDAKALRSGARSPPRSRTFLPQKCRRVEASSLGSAGPPLMTRVLEMVGLRPKRLVPPYSHPPGTSKWNKIEHRVFRFIRLFFGVGQSRVLTLSGVLRVVQGQESLLNVFVVTIGRM